MQIVVRILIVEDDQLIGQIVCDTLTSEGYAVDWHQHGGHAAQSIKDNSYQIILLDSNLPKISGIELLKLIRKKSTEVPVIIFTAQSTHEHQQTYIQAGANAYLSKPFELTELLKNIESLVAID